MKRVIIAVCGFALFLPAVASAQVSHGDSRKVTMYISDAFTAGATTVKPGEYKFQCKLIDGQHYLVITSAEDNKEIARVPCTPETLKAPAETNQFLSRKSGSGVVLTAVRFKGEAIAHRVVAPVN